MRVDGQLTFNTSFPMIDAVLTGTASLSSRKTSCAKHIADGRLVLVLDDWCPCFSGFHLYYPSRRQLSPAMSVIVDALRFRAAAR